MNSTPEKCSRCGTQLPAGADQRECQKCLLEAALASGTDFSLGDVAETLPYDAGSPPSDSHAAVTPYVHHSGLANYHDLQVIHDWSGGTVYRAFHEGLQRPVLLRVLESYADDASRREFLRRAETLSRISHPNTVGTLEAGVDRGAAYVAEDWVEGQPVGGFLPRTRPERWAEGFYPNAELAGIMRDAASGLEAIHQSGLTHDRINPDCLVVDTGGMVRLIGLGEASASSDERFACPREVSGVEEQRSVAADLFRLGATFCFLTTGKLPIEVDPSLRFPGLARRLKKLNPGLRTDLCEAVAHCLTDTSVLADRIAVANESTPRSGEREDERRETKSENPYANTKQARTIRYVAARDLVEELDRLLATDVTRATWKQRVSSGYLEMFCCSLLAAFVQTWLMARYDGTGKGMPVFMTTLVVSVPIVYSILLETLLGWTPIRRFFGMRLLDHAGERAAWWRRLGRAVQKSLLLILAVTIPAMATPVLGMIGLPSVANAFFLVTSALFLPPLVLYLPARWIPSRWTNYDLMAGTTWGEKTHHDPTAISAALPPTVTSPASSPTDRIDQYDLFEPLGRGGMGRVYRARDRILRREVAVKLLTASLVENPLLLERFQREARLAAKVSHPGVAKVYGNGLRGQTPYIAMELVHGKTLQQLVQQQGRLPTDIVWNYGTQTAVALRAADCSGVVHRDIKPANLMVTEDGRLKVTDFGVSRSVTVDHGVTEHGTIVGTPAYMAPEQAMGKEVDCRADIYALGMTMYHMLSGHTPFKASNAVEMLAQQMSEHPPSLEGEIDGLTSEQVGVLARMIAKKPSERYADYDGLIKDLNRNAPGADRLASPLKRIAAEACHWALGYLCFTLSMFSLYLFGPYLGLAARGGTLIVGGLCLLIYLAFVGMYIVGVARDGTTPGKRLLGLRVVGKSERRIGYARSVARFAIAYPLMATYVPRMIHYVIAQVPLLPYEIPVTTILLALQAASTLASLAMLAMHPEHRTLHDLISGTTVVREID